MSIIGAYRIAKVLIDLGHADSPVIPHKDMTMAADLADVPRPVTEAERAAVCETLDELTTGRP